MIITLEEHKQLLKKMIAADVEFILIGGYAVNYHGYNRPTGDMDIWLKPDNSNRDTLLDLFLKEGFEKVVIDKLKKTDFSLPVVFHIGKPPKRIDFLTVISNVTFEDAWKEKQLLPLENIFIPVLNLDHLILSKISNNRSRDQFDVEELQKIKQYKNNE